MSRSFHFLVPALASLALAAAAQAGQGGFTPGPAHPATGEERRQLLAKLQAATPLLPALHGGAYIFKFNFVAADTAGDRATGFLQQAWQSETQWIWTAHLGETPMDRMAKGHDVVTTQGPLSLVSLREMMLRSALFAPEGSPPPPATASLRVSAASLGGVSLDCLLFARAVVGTDSPERAPQEQMDCLDAAFHLVVASPVPGYFVLYGYAEGNQAGITSIAVSQAGNTVLDAKLDFALPLTGPLPMTWLDGGGGSAEQAKPAADASSDSLAMKRNCRSCLATMNDTDNALEKVSNVAGPQIEWRTVRMPPGAPPAATAYVVVHASLAPNGTVSDSESWGDTSPTLQAAAQEQLKKSPFGKSPDQREVFLGVAFERTQ